jgi:drug/metabolite transporter (DMT)-like permease
MMLTALLWSTGGLLIKLVDWHPIAISGARSGIATLVLLPFVRFNKNWTIQKILGILAYVATVSLFVSANKLTTSANAILLQFSAPVWVVLFSRWFYHEKMRRSDYVSLIFVFLGMGIFFVESLDSGRFLGNVLGLMSGVSFGGMIVLLKHQSKASSDGPLNIIFYGNLLTCIISSPFFLIGMPNGKSILGLLLLGVFQIGLAYLLYAKAILYISALEAILIPVIEPLLNPVWVLLFFGERPSQMALIGGSIVVVTLLARSVHQVKNPLASAIPM